MDTGDVARLGGRICVHQCGGVVGDFAKRVSEQLGQGPISVGLRVGKHRERDEVVQHEVLVVAVIVGVVLARH